MIKKKAVRKKTAAKKASTKKKTAAKKASTKKKAVAKKASTKKKTVAKKASTKKKTTSADAPVPPPAQETAPEVQGSAGAPEEETMTNNPKRTVIRMSAAERQAQRQARAGKVKARTPEPARTHGDNGVPMSFAERQRAEAEAAFKKIAPSWTTEPEPADEPEMNLPIHKSEFQIRISEQDSLTTQLRLSEGAAAKRAAKELAERFRLPPDQSLLVKVIGLADKSLLRLALEELLELDDRGRVRANPDLIDALQSIRSRDKEVKELRALFLEKLNIAPT